MPHFFVSNDLGHVSIWESSDSIGTSWTEITAGFTDYIAGTYIANNQWLKMPISIPTSDTGYFVGLAYNNTASVYKFNITGTPHIQKVYDNLPGAYDHNRVTFAVSDSGISNNFNSFKQWYSL